MIGTLGKLYVASGCSCVRTCSRGSSSSQKLVLAPNIFLEAKLLFSPNNKYSFLSRVYSGHVTKSDVAALFGFLQLKRTKIVQLLSDESCMLKLFYCFI